MRKFIILSLMALGFFAASPAKALLVSNGDVVEISGPFGPQPGGLFTNPIETLVVETNFSMGTYPYPQVQAGYIATAGGAGWNLATCASNVPGPCYVPVGQQGPTQVQISILTPATFVISASFTPWSSSGDTSRITGSTLLIGFAAIGLFAAASRQPPINDASTNLAP